MNSNIQPVAVAVADVNRHRRAEYERILQADPGIRLIADKVTGNGVGNDPAFVNRRFAPRTDVSVTEDEVARIKRLKPPVLLVNLNLCEDEDCALLLSLRRECPDAILVFLADDSVSESQIMRILEIGARGYLKNETVRLYLSKAIQVVGRGEAWVPRKMLGNIMENMLN